MTKPLDHGHVGRRHCENCAAPLRGHFCHQCGQSLASPTRHFGHAFADVFESFWHLDGRIFLTLRDLLWPGRVAANYIAGHRARYIAPLRLFVILSVLTFFVAQYEVSEGRKGRPLQIGFVEMSVSVTEGEQAKRVDRRSSAPVANPITPAAGLVGIDQLRDRQPGSLDRPPTALSSKDAIERNKHFGAIRDNNSSAGCRAAKLLVKRTIATEGPGTLTKDAEPDVDIECGKDGLTVFDNRPWDLDAEFLSAPWAPDFVNRWLNRQLVYAKANFSRLDDELAWYMHVLIRAVPSALFLLTPIFGLILKVAYVGSGWRYLEHLVVVLYSHAFLCIALLVTLTLSKLDNAISPHWFAFNRISDWLFGLLWFLVPVYLLMMQKRVYGHHWPSTLIRYLVIGSLYLVLIAFTLVILSIIALVRM
jgi:hypothetical protein